MPAASVLANLLHYSGAARAREAESQKREFAEARKFVRAPCARRYTRARGARTNLAKRSNPCLTPRR